TASHRTDQIPESRFRSCGILVPERLDRVESAGAMRGIDPEEDPDPDREQERDSDAERSDRHLYSGGQTDDAREREADRHADDAAGPGERHRLDQELSEDVAPARSQSGPQSDLARALLHQDQHH